MRLLRLQTTGDITIPRLTLTPELKSSDLPRYGILSHTWGPDDSELTFEDVSTASGTHKPGYRKVVFCGEQARKDGLEHFWVDSCCINKTNSAELSEAIISMFEWYKNAEKCYVYLSDLSQKREDEESGGSESGGEELSVGPSSRRSHDKKRSWEEGFKQSKWFTRGWTLQELLAPSIVEFYSQEGTLLGDKQELGALIKNITGIPWSALQGTDLSSFGFAEKLGWASKRTTTRVEDQAYCLLGIFNVFIPPMYGEGKNAFVRLEEEIWKRERSAGEAMVPVLRSGTMEIQRRGTVAEDSNGAMAKVLDGLPVAKQAGFDSVSKQDDPVCLPETRVGVLKRIKAWAYGNDESCIFWLNGMAGTGKSTIARTIAREFAERGHLGASFFFARGDGDVAHAGLFFTTIAKQLTRSCPSMAQLLVDALEKEPDLPSKTRYDQWSKMIVEPLNKMPTSAFSTPQVLIVVIDALDECSNDNDIKGIIKLLSEAKNIINTKLRIVVTSRPETPIRLGFKLMPQVLHQDLLLHDERREVVDADICMYLYEEFKKVKMIQDWLSEDWPGIDAINKLVQLAGGLFIVAATICRLVVEDDDRGADGSVDFFLGARVDGMDEKSDAGSESSIDPTFFLDRLYAQVLGKASQQTNSILDILGTVAALNEPLSVTSLAQLLMVRPDDIHRRLNKLHSVVYVPTGDREPIRLLHTSFRDFLFDKNRGSVLLIEDGMEVSKPMYVDKQQLHWGLALQCLQLLSRSGQLRRDMCAIGRPGVRRYEVDDCDIDKAITAEVSYACRYWVLHVKESESKIRDGDEVHKFLQSYWLYWIETLSWLRWLSRSLDQMTTLQELVEPYSDAGSFIRDALRFLFSNRMIIDEAPLQLYCSALIFAPAQSLIRKRFQHDILVHLDIDPHVPVYWGLELFKLEGHDCSVLWVCVSSDGALVASGAEDGTVVIWNLATGALVQSLKGFYSAINTVAFSPDGHRVAVGRANGDVLVWTTGLDDSIQQLVIGRNLLDDPGIAHVTICLTFSPDGQYIASSTEDGTVRIWNVAGDLVKQMEGHVGRAIGIVYSPDGNFIASSSLNNTVQIWNTETGVFAEPTRHYSFSVHDMAFMSDDRLVVSGWLPGDQFEVYATSEEKVKEFYGHRKHISSVALSRDAAQIAAASTDGTIRIWDFKTESIINLFDGHESFIRSLAFSPNGQVLVSASHDFTARVWDLRAPGPLQHTRSDNHQITQARFSPDGQQIATISGRRLIFFNATRGESEMQVAKSIHPFAIDFSPDGELIATVSNDSSESLVSLWDLQTRQEVWRFAETASLVSHIAFSPNGQLIAAGSDDGILQIWHVASCELIFSVSEMLDGLASMAFSPNGEYIMSGGRDHTLRVWNVETSARMLSLEHQSDQDECFHGAAFSSDGTLVAEGSRGMVTIWITSTGEPILFLGDSDEEYYCVAFSHHDNLVAAYAPEMGQITIWNTSTGEEIQRLGGQRLLSSISFSPNGEYLNTNIGQIRITHDLSSSASQSEAEISIQLAGRWIRHKNVDVLWLPYEYGGRQSLCHKDTLVLVQPRGELTFIRFTSRPRDKEKMNEQAVDGSASVIPRTIRWHRNA